MMIKISVPNLPEKTPETKTKKKLRFYLQFEIVFRAAACSGALTLEICVSYKSKKKN